MNDDLRLSLFMDGRLPDRERVTFEARLATDPALRARLDALKGLEALSRGLAPAAAAFSADDVRVRAEFRPKSGWRRLGVAAAAVLALAATHAAVYVAGARRGAATEQAERASVEETAAFLERTAALDIAAPANQLEDELRTLRREIPTQLVALSRARQPEAVQYADALRQMQTDLAVGQQRDPGFLCLRVAAIAQSSLDGGTQWRLVPATATNYVRVVPAGVGRYRVILIENVNETPRTVVDEGTPEELEARHGVRLRRQENGR